MVIGHDEFGEVVVPLAGPVAAAIWRSLVFEDLEREIYLRIQTNTGRFVAFCGVKTLKKRQSSFPTSVAVKLKFFGLVASAEFSASRTARRLTAAHHFPVGISKDKP